MPVLQFELTDQKAILAHLNTRTEKNGKEEVRAADLKIECFQRADIMSTFSSTLKAHLFNPNSLDLADGMALMHPELKTPIGVAGSMTGAEVRIEYGVKQPIVLKDCKVNNFKVDPKEGGSVHLSFRIQAQPDDTQIGKLYKLQRREINITIVPADLPEMAEGGEKKAAE